MIILDTNILSELMRSAPDPSVLAWIDSLPAREIFLIAITVAECLYGVERLPAGKRKASLARALSSMLVEDLDGRVLAFDGAAAVRYAALVAAGERSGHPVSMADGQIAAICQVHSAILATRNVKDFGRLGIALHNPFPK
ncbi:type II toxin-antitoxin system VapC family toxin [Pseudoduganella aquatica]|uniref:Ribonuclease VapC n=1 Tax=Pseudoduganella aquatica TaxID=2660641 RepID=A0A7X4H8C1_9BURK|nr:type II toxin-antitoxin system VapC family toxin [Pseudoduganella aquatica]MYN05812.1 PIN domain-containing protein [Pseudoduganella aquatica]